MHPRTDEALAALGKEIAALYFAENCLDPTRGSFDETLVNMVEHAIVYAFRVGYRARVGEETAEERAPS